MDGPDYPVESASQRGARVTRALVDAAERFGLTAVTEYAFPGARIDVVWQWRPSSPIPGVEALLPIVGFEIESSWRVRKHIKGDLVNLQDLRPLVGVIVLCGDGPEVESTRRFASQLVDRRGTRIVVWSEEDVDALVAGDAGDLDLLPLEPVLRSSPPGTVHEHAGKYRPLWECFVARSNRQSLPRLLSSKSRSDFRCRRHRDGIYRTGTATKEPPLGVQSAMPVGVPATSTSPRSR